MFLGSGLLGPLGATLLRKSWEVVVEYPICVEVFSNSSRDTRIFYYSSLVHFLTDARKKYRGQRLGDVYRPDA